MKQNNFIEKSHLQFLDNKMQLLGIFKNYQLI